MEITHNQIHEAYAQAKRVLSGELTISDEPLAKLFEFNELALK